MMLRLVQILLALLLLVPVQATAARRSEATVVVEVRDPDGRPVDGATVTVNEHEAGQTGPDGRFAISDLRPGREAVVEVAKPGSAWAPAVLPALEVEAGETTMVVTLERSRAARRLPSELTIIATDPRGRPVAGATVTIDGLKKGRTDATGTLLYAGRRAGATIVLGIASFEGDRKLSAVTTVDLLGGPQVARVSLLPEEEPEVAEAAEAPAPAAEPEEDPRRSDRDGDGRPDRRDQCPDEAEVYNRYKDNDGCPDELATLVIWVMDPDGHPVEGATVTLNGADAGRTGADGAFSVPELRPGTSVRTGVSAPLMFPVELERIQLDEGRQAHTVVLKPIDTDGDGRPDRVDACPDQPETFNRFRDEDGCPDDLGVLSVLVLDPDGDPVPDALVMVDEREAGHTNAEGRVLVTNVMPGTRVAVRAEKPDPMLAPGGIGAVDLRPGAQSVTLSLQRSPEALALAPELNILVVAPPDGKPVPWAMVFVDGLPKGRTDRSGAYRYVGRSAGTTLVVAIGEPRADRVISAMKSIRLDGGPQRLRMWLGGGDGGVGAVSARDSDGDGTVDTYDACPDQVEVVNGYLDGDGCPDELATVALRVVDPGGGAVSGAVVYANGAEIGRTGTDGTLTVPALIPGSIAMVEVAKPETDLLPVATQLDDLVEGSQSRDVVMQWKDTDGDGIVESADRCPYREETPNGYRDDDGCPDKLAMVVLKVSDAQGAALPGVPVSIGDREVGLTEPDGRLRIGDLMPGTRTVFLIGPEHPGGEWATLEVELIEGTQVHTVRLGP